MTEEAQDNTQAADVNEQNSTPSAADKMYGGTQESNASEESEGSDETKDQADDAPESKDEAKEESGDADKDGEESEEKGDQDAIDYSEIKLPEGLPEGVEMDEALFGEVKDWGQKNSIPTEAMQEIVDVYAKRVADGDQAIKDQWNAVEAGWKETAKTDKEIGGDKFDSKVLLAQKAIDKFGTPALKEALEQTRVGNHPEFIRAFSRVGESMSEAGLFDTGDGGGQRSRGDILFDKT